MADQEMQKLVDAAGAHAHALILEKSLADEAFDFLRAAEIEVTDYPAALAELGALRRKQREIDGTPDSIDKHFARDVSRFRG